MTMKELDALRDRIQELETACGECPGQGPNCWKHCTTGKHTEHLNDILRREFPKVKEEA